MTNHDDFQTRNHDLQWAARERALQPLEPAARGRARAALLDHIEEATPAQRISSASSSEPFTIRRSSRPIRRLATRVAAVGAVAVAAVIGISSLPAKPHSAGVADAAVLTHLRAAVLKPDDRIFYGHDASGDLFWSSADAAIQRHVIFEDGKPVLDGTTWQHTTDGVFHFRLLSVDLVHRQYSEEETSHRVAPLADSGATTPTLPAGLSSSSATIVSALKANKVTVVTRGTFRGQPAIRLRIAPNEGFDGLLWVNADSYQPLQLTESKGGKVTDTQEWLPRTPENVAKLTVEVPKGFAKVDQLHP